MRGLGGEARKNRYVAFVTSFGDPQLAWLTDSGDANFKMVVNE